MGGLDLFCDPGFTFTDTRDTQECAPFASKQRQYAHVAINHFPVVLGPRIPLTLATLSKSGRDGSV